MKINETYQRFLSEQALNNLKKLIGTNVYQIFSPRIKVDYDEIIVAKTFSFSKDKEWYNFSNEWEETAKDFTFHDFQLNMSTSPTNIRYDINSRSIYDSCSILIPTDKSTIVKIEVYYLDESSETDKEEVIYDYAVLFIFENGYSFCISVYEESISDELLLIKRKSAIQNRLKEAKLRVTL